MHLHSISQPFVDETVQPRLGGHLLQRAPEPQGAVRCREGICISANEGSLTRCACVPALPARREYSLRHWNHVSQVYWKPLLEVELWNASRACAVRVTNPLRDSNDTKLKAGAPSACVAWRLSPSASAAVQKQPLRGIAWGHSLLLMIKFRGAQHWIGVAPVTISAAQALLPTLHPVVYQSGAGIRLH